MTPFEAIERAVLQPQAGRRLERRHLARDGVEDVSGERAGKERVVKEARLGFQPPGIGGEIARHLKGVVEPGSIIVLPAGARARLALAVARRRSPVLDEIGKVPGEVHRQRHRLARFDRGLEHDRAHVTLSLGRGGVVGALGQRAARGELIPELVEGVVPTAPEPAGLVVDLGPRRGEGHGAEPRVVLCVAIAAHEQAAYALALEVGVRRTAHVRRIERALARVADRVVQVCRQRNLHRALAWVVELDLQDRRRQARVLVVERDKGVVGVQGHLERHIRVLELDPGQRVLAVKGALPQVREPRTVEARDAKAIPLKVRSALAREGRMGWRLHDLGDRRLSFSLCPQGEERVGQERTDVGPVKDLPVAQCTGARERHAARADPADRKGDLGKPGALVRPRRAKLVQLTL